MMRCLSSSSSSTTLSSSTDATKSEDALRTPLLGDSEPEFAIIEDGCCYEDQDSFDNDDESSSSTPTSVESWCDSILAWFVLPCLLWLDFWLVLHNNNNSMNDGEAMSMSTSASAAPTVTMTSVHFSFFMFIVATFMYRKTLEENHFEAVLLLLVPEIAMNAMLLLIFANQTLAAYLLLLAVILGLSIVVVIVSAIRLGCVYEVDAATTPSNEGKQVDEHEQEEDDLEGGVVVVPATVSSRR